jgi:glycosyltransferase involved in cell wall biosynthesis
MAAGLPVVISPQVNIAGDVRSARAGVVCERTPDAFASAIGDLLCDPGEREALGERARTFARRYDWSNVGPQLAAMYAGVVGRRAVVGEKDVRHAA